MKMIKPDPVLLLGPGPSPVHPRVLKALGQHTLGHLDGDFLEIMNRIAVLLRQVFETENKITFPVSATGSAGMEAALVNMLEPGDKAVIIVKGVFGERMADVAGRCGAEVLTVEAPWGQAADPGALEAVLRANPGVRLVGVVHAETSTGVLQPLDELISLAHSHGALTLVDTVTSLGGVPVGVDRHGIDVAYSGNQKCLAAPPGLAPITFGEKALERFSARTSKVQSWYLDLSFLTRYWGEERFYHHTAPVNMNYALLEALEMIVEEGLEKRFARHRLHSRALLAGLNALDVKGVVGEEHRLPSLTAVWIPEGLDDLAVRSRLRSEHLIEIGGGLGPFKGRVWRIGLMGNGSRRENVERLLQALAAVFQDLGRPASASEALAATAGIYDSEK